jgi:hypothetical protein
LGGRQKGKSGLEGGVARARYKREGEEGTNRKRKGRVVKAVRNRKNFLGNDENRSPF